MDPTNVTGLNITIDKADQLIANSVSVQVAGELDMHTAPSLRGAVSELVNSHPGTSVALDVEALTFTDSSGLSALIAIHKLTNASGGQLMLRRPDPRLRRMLSITGLDKVLVVQAPPISPPGRGGDTTRGRE
jgi:anti-sigma B factor antagonist